MLTGVGLIGWAAVNGFAGGPLDGGALAVLAVLDAIGLGLAGYMGWQCATSAPSPSASRR